MVGLPLREEQLKFRLLWIGIFCVTLLFASVIYPQNTLSLRSLNRVLLVAIVWNLIVFFTPLAKKLRGAFDVVAIVVDLLLITWTVRVTGGFQSEFGLLYFVELVLAAVFTERLQLLLAFFFSAAGLCSSLLSFHAEGAASGESGSFLIRVSRWRPEDLSALGVRAVTLVAVYLIGYVGRSFFEHREVKAGAQGPGGPAPVIPPSSKTAPVLESTGTELKQTAPVGEHLSIISHELRSPLTILRAYTDLLMDPNRQNEAGEIITKIDEEVTQLSEMITNLDAIVDERAAPSPEAMRNLDLGVLLRSLLEKQKSLSVRHEFVFRCVQSEIPVRGDKIKLSRAFSNLLGNAVKYSPEGGRIEVTADIQDRRQIGFLSRPALSDSSAERFAVVRVTEIGRAHV